MITPPSQPTTLILFGSTGDLTRLKIIPALRELWIKGIINHDLEIVAVGRRAYSTADYLEFLQTADTHPVTEDISMLNITYLELDFDTKTGFDTLWKYLQSQHQRHIVFYMALGAKVLDLTIGQLSHENSAHALKLLNATIVVEKPFGTSAQHARELHHQLIKLFPRERIYRNDHFLFKEPIHSLSQVLQNDERLLRAMQQGQVESVTVVNSEQVDTSGRADYFDKTGLIIDMFQSHQLQIVAQLCAEVAEHDTQATSKAHFLESLEYVADSLVRGQYAGYAEHEGVQEGSDTETFYAFTMTSRIPDWKQLKFKFTAGKGLAEKYTGLLWKFKPNIPGFEREELWKLIPLEHAHPTIEGNTHTEYQQVLCAAWNNQRERFVSQAEVEAQWVATESIREDCENCELITYKKGKSIQNVGNGSYL